MSRLLWGTLISLISLLRTLISLISLPLGKQEVKSPSWHGNWWGAECGSEGGGCAVWVEPASGHPEVRQEERHEKCVCGDRAVHLSAES